MDFKSEFETTDRQILLSKLEKHDKPTGHRVQLVSELFIGKKTDEKSELHAFRSSENKIGSATGITARGIIVLGILINGIKSALMHTKITLFADDVLVFVDGKDVKGIINNLIMDLKELSECLRKNKLKLNVK